MTYTVIECADKQMLDAFRQSAEFDAEFGSANPVTTQGLQEQAELDDQGNVGPMYWLLVEDSRPLDNATFRLDGKGLHFHATGVEV